MSKRGKGKKVSKRDQFKTGYGNPDLVSDALHNSGGGRQKSKRDRLKWDDRDPRPFQGGAPGLGKRS